ncbi:glycosyltransferase family 8 protein [Pedobacter antarcticus]|uniref:glycosyltransferase family 8 protein n=1 Tax=Pedobacter antarcticus TaxID=34086 RepID=UPI001C59A714|nr:glycosyltransferase family 8 protein [Pedobacter antarcticus]
MSDYIRKEGVPIVLAFTPSYFIPAATFLNSLLENSDLSDCYDLICLLTEDLPEVMKRELECLGGERIAVTYMNLDGYLKEIYIDDRYTVAASFRLILPDVLPGYDKVLYMDCDIIVRNNMAELYRSSDMGDRYLAAVHEATLDFQEKNIKDLGCEPGYYFNSGVLLMNLTLMRKNNMTEKFLEAAQIEGLEFPDQDVLNQLCKGNVLALAPHYNSIRTFYLPKYKADFLKRYNEADWDAVQKHGNVHYTGSKPWNSFTVEFDVWWESYFNLPKSIRSYGQISKKMLIFSKMYKTNMGKRLIDMLRNLYRKIK